MYCALFVNPALITGVSCAKCLDFGDCFEVSQVRERFPERVPFRLTRMFVRAFAVGGLEGSFRDTAERTMRLLRKNKNSVMAVLEAFSLDPLLNWRLADMRKKPKQPVSVIPNHAARNVIRAVAGAPTTIPPPPIVGEIKSTEGVSSTQQQPPPFLVGPVAAPHSHVDVEKESHIVPVVTEHLLIEGQRTALQSAPKNVFATDSAATSAAGSSPSPPTPAPAAAAAAPLAPTSILGLLQIPYERGGALGHGAAAVPTAVPTMPTGASTAHAKAEAVIVAAAAEPGFGGTSKKSVPTVGGGLGAVDEGDEEREMPPSPAQRRRSVVDESTLALGGGREGQMQLQLRIDMSDGNEVGGSYISRAARDALASAAATTRLEQLNAQASAVMARVEAKLKGTEFNNECGPPPAGVTRVVGFQIGTTSSSSGNMNGPTGSNSDTSSVSSMPPMSPLNATATVSAHTPAAVSASTAPLTVAAQVERLVAEATSHNNLAQSYLGWCPWW
jgi:hypothetical protein